MLPWQRHRHSTDSVHMFHGSMSAFDQLNTPLGTRDSIRPEGDLRTSGPPRESKPAGRRPVGGPSTLRVRCLWTSIGEQRRPLTRREWLDRPARGFAVLLTG